MCNYRREFSVCTVQTSEIKVDIRIGMVSDRSTEPKSVGNKGRGALIKHVQNIPMK